MDPHLPRKPQNSTKLPGPRPTHLSPLVLGLQGRGRESGQG